MAAHNIEPAYTPTYSSWLNAIEAHVTSLKTFAIGGTDDPSHECRRWRIARYLTWRSKEKGSSKAALAQFSRVRLYRQLVPSSSTDQLLVSTMVIRRAERAAGCRPS
jgi:hypothetical protein